MKPDYPLVCKVNIQSQKKYQKGDVISFINKGRLLFPRYCHRIVAINEKVFTAKGDNRKYSDFFETNVPLENIEGKIIDIKRMV